MYAAVVDDVRLDDAVAVGLHDLSQSPAQQVVADVAEVQGLVGIGAGVFYHHQRAVLRDGLEAEAGVLADGLEQGYPLLRTNAEVEEALHDVVCADDFWQSLHELLTYLLRRSVGSLVAHLGERKADDCQLSLKLWPGLLQLHHLLLNWLPVELLHYGLHGLRYPCLYLHFPIHYIYYALQRYNK